MVNLAKRSDNNIIYKNPYFRSGIKEINSSTSIPETFEIMKKKMIELFETFTNEGSGWIFQNIDHLILNVDKNIPLNGSSYIDLPKEIKTKKAVINVKNKDDRCFEYAILSAQHNKEIKEKHERPSKYKEHLNNLILLVLNFQFH